MSENKIYKVEIEAIYEEFGKKSDILAFRVKQPNTAAAILEALDKAEATFHSDMNVYYEIMSIEEQDNNNENS